MTRDLDVSNTNLHPTILHTYLLCRVCICSIVIAIMVIDTIFHNFFIIECIHSFKWNAIKDHPKVSSLLYNFILQMSLRSNVSYKFGLIFKFQINKISFISIYVLPPFCQDVMQMWEWWWWYWIENSNIRNSLPPRPPSSLRYIFWYDRLTWYNFT